ncbi:MAG TPA: ABC transporter permease [Longimicrobiales bacterium]|jgi:predicted permease
MAFRRTFRRPDRGPDDARSAVDEELAFHLEEAEEELVAGGLTPAQARDEAVRRFGDVDETRHYCADQQTRRETREGWTMRLDELRQDLGFALRTLGKARAYSTVVALTLAVGIAACTVIFSLMNPYFFRPLPFEDADRLVQLGHVDARYGWDGARFSLDMIEDYRQRSRALDGLGAYYYGSAALTGPEGPEAVSVGYLTDNLFQVLGSSAALGRTFGPGEGGPRGENVVVVDHGLWQRRWTGDPGILGRSVSLDGVPYTVIGIMPATFSFPFGGVKLWVPDRASAASLERDADYYLPVARLAGGWTRERAAEELGQIHASLAAEHPDEDGAYSGISVKGIREALNFAWDILTVGLSTLLASVLFVLAIACVNVASLTLARAQGRSREIAVRTAIGAGRGRIVRQLVTESLALSVLGGVLGTALAYWVVGMVGPSVPEDLYRVGAVTVDRTVLLFALAVTLGTPLLFGLAPALSVARTELSSALREGGRGAGSGRAALRTRRALVVAEVALAVVLVVGTGLMVRSFQQVQNVDMGFQADRVLTAEVIPPGTDYPQQADFEGYFERAGDVVASVPGVEAVGQIYPLPLNHETIPIVFAPAGRESADQDDWPNALWASVTPEYFGSMGVPLVAGRTFSSEDEAAGNRVVVVSRSLAERHFPGEEAVGRSLTLLLGGARAPATIVGVVGDVVHSGFAAGSTDLHIYQPQTQNSRRRRFFVLRTPGDPAELVGPVRGALESVDRNLPVTLRPMNDIVLENTYQWSASSLFMGAFGLVAVLLASLGVYGLVSYSVAQRRKELGIRMAIGAEAATIGKLLIGEGLRLTLLGSVIGLAAALGLGRFTAALLYNVSPFDAPTFVGVVLLFGVVAVAASYPPALRATRVDPVTVLRQE